MMTMHETRGSRTLRFLCTNPHCEQIDWYVTGYVTNGMWDPERDEDQDCPDCGAEGHCDD